MPSAKNQQQVQELVELLKDADGLVLTEYRGLSVAEVTELRRKLAESSQGVYKVAKNTLVRIALENLGQPQMDEYLAGPTAVAISRGDVVRLAKDLDEFAKKHDRFVIKAGLIDGQVFSGEQVKAIAKLPPREELVAKLLGSLQAPLYGLASVMIGPVRGLAIALSEIAKKNAAPGESLG